MKALLVLLLLTACGPDNSAERKQRLLTTIKARHVPIATGNPTVSDFERHSTLDEATITIPSSQGDLTQRVFVSPDDHTVYLVIAEVLDDSGEPSALQSTVQDARAARRADLSEETRGFLARGPAEAKVDVVFFADFGSEVAAGVAVAVNGLEVARPGEVRTVLVQLPHPQHVWSSKAALATLCAELQGADVAWGLYDAYWREQSTLGRDDDLPKSVAEMSGKLDRVRLEACMTEGTDEHRRALERLAAHQSVAARFGVEQAPTLFVNGELVRGAISATDLMALAAVMARPPPR